ncbi:MAG: hypothetical protein SPI03_03630 [Campylobacter sputorum]|uniref:hypothetical protein n=1 Tax=Campylobacter sputorum TaxID=206 RepID=UPI002A90D0D5|nr:hypothetical protein [Campylobacter sputorum]MDY6120416.1 hypothetical protein [Campylobacter sputorum]
MEYRQFEIAFYGIEWHIALYNYDEKKDGGVPLKGVIKPIVTTKDNKIAYIFDVFNPSDDEIEDCKKYKIFSEICEFNFFDSVTGKYTDKFQGTFIDALKYIQQNYEA